MKKIKTKPKTQSKTTYSNPLAIDTTCWTLNNSSHNDLDDNLERESSEWNKNFINENTLKHTHTKPLSPKQPHLSSIQKPNLQMKDMKAIYRCLGDWMGL